jgi:hypothetical protein
VIADEVERQCGYSIAWGEFERDRREATFLFCASANVALKRSFRKWSFLGEYRFARKIRRYFLQFAAEQLATLRAKRPPPLLHVPVGQ